VQSLEDARFVFRRTVIIGAAICLNILAYAVLVEILRATIKPFHGFIPVPFGKVQTIRYAAYGFAIVVLLVIRLMRARLFRAAPGEPPKTTLMRLTRMSVLTFVLAEIPALAGIVLFFATGWSRDFYVLLAVALVLEFMYFPRRSQWDELLSRAGGGRP
jgi:hypothetical protein